MRFLLAITFIALVVKRAVCCTEVQIMAPTGDLVVANSLEAGRMGPVIATPFLRGSKHGGHRAGCLTFVSKYGFVGGMSEVGLAVNEHALDLAVFQTPHPDTPSVCKEDFSHWAMAMHATVAELIDGLAKVRVVGGRGGGQWGVQDATGQAIVVEFIKGELNVHNNSVGRDNSGIGIMTNDPTWDWHLQNVNNYAALQPGWYSANNQHIQRAVPATETHYPWATNAYNTLPPLIPSPIGHGYNLLGLPGDGSPPSRFIRAFFTRGYALANNPPKTLNQTLVLGQELLNSVYKTLGSIAQRNSLDPMETTPIASLKITSATQRVVMYRSREDMRWRMLNLSKMDFSELSATANKSVALTSTSFHCDDVTDQLLMK